jgi:hypothetical protein
MDVIERWPAHEGRSLVKKILTTDDTRASPALRFFYLERPRICRRFCRKDLPKSAELQTIVIIVLKVDRAGIEPAT